MRNFALTLALLSSVTSLWAGGGGGEDDDDGDIQLAPLAAPKKAPEDLIANFKTSLQEHIKQPAVYESYLTYLEERTQVNTLATKEGLWVFLLKVLPLMPEQHRDFATLTRICTLHQYLGTEWCHVLFRALNKTKHKTELKEKLMDLLLGFNKVPSAKVPRLLEIVKSLCRDECTVEHVMTLTNRLNGLSEEDLKILEMHKARIGTDQHGRFYLQPFLNVVSTLEALSDKEIFLSPIIDAINLHYGNFEGKQVDRIRQHVRASDIRPYRQRFLITLNTCDAVMFESIMAYYVSFLRVSHFARAWEFAKETLQFDCKLMTDLIQGERRKIESQENYSDIKGMASLPLPIAKGAQPPIPPSVQPTLQGQPTAKSKEKSWWDISIRQIFSNPSIFRRG